MVVEKRKYYEGDPDVHNGVRWFREVVGICDSCGGEIPPKEYVYAYDGGYICEKCFLEANRESTVEDLVKSGEVEVIEK